MSDTAEPRIVVLMPIYDDWESASVLVGRVRSATRSLPCEIHFLLVDDGSSQEPPAFIEVAEPSQTLVEVLRLRRNVGHQRAIAIGLSWVQENRRCRGVVVMDGDGEDTPDGVVKLLARFEEHDATKTIFAARARRTEGLMFRVFYLCFRVLHRLLTGRVVRVGNFSAIPLRHVDRLVAVSELWNHYPAAVFKARIAVDTVPVDRGNRIAGESKMNFVSLLAHGLSAVSVFADVVGLRLLVATSVLALAALSGVVAVVAVRLTTDLAIPGWATASTGVLVIILLQAFLMATIFVFITLQGRSTLGFLPIRDHRFFVDRAEKVELRE